MNLNEIRSGLSVAIEELSIRSLKISSKWTSEQLLGMKNDFNLQNEEMNLKLYSNHIEVNINERDIIHFSNLLISSGEYQRCAHLLRLKLEQGLLNSEIGVFLLVYSLYLAGEKIKEQNTAENSGNQSNSKELNTNQSMNPFLNEIFHILFPIYYKTQQKNENIFKENFKIKTLTTATMDGFLYYIFGIVVRDIRLSNQSSIGDIIHEIKEFDNKVVPIIPHAYELLFKSVELVPYNWSCWLEISSGYSFNNDFASTSETHLPPFPQWITQISHKLTNPQFSIDSNNLHLNLNLKECMVGMFTVQMLLEQQKGNIALTVLSSLEKIFPNSQVVRSQIALAYYNLRDYHNAQEIFERNHLDDPYRLENLDVYSNILYVKEKRAELSHLAHTCVKVDKFRPETCCIIGNYYSLKGQHEKAVINFQRALKVDRKYLPAWTLMGHEYVELRNTAAAVQCYRQAVEVNRCDYRAWYGLGQTYEMLHLHLYSLHYYKRAATLRPIDARMWCAVGNCLSRLTFGGVHSTSLNPIYSREMSLNAKREAIEAYKRAVACEDSEGLATRELARLYRDLGDNIKAAEYYQRHVYDRLDIKYDEKNLNNMTNEIEFFQQNDNLVIDSDIAEGLLFLANTAYHNSDYLTAETYCLKLLDYRGPESADAKNILKNIRRTTLNST